MWKRVLRILTIFYGRGNDAEKETFTVEKAGQCSTGISGSNREERYQGIPAVLRSERGCHRGSSAKSSGMYSGKVSAVLFGSQERAVLVLYGAAEFKTKSQGRRSAALQRTVCA